MTVKGRSYLVTGAQQGIGAGIALELARNGANVVINYLDDEMAAEAVAQQARQYGVQALTFQADVRSSDQVANMVAATRERFGTIDGLVNNAAIFPRNALVDIPEAEWDMVMAVNLKGTFLATQCVARAMIEQGTGGAIVNISSGAGTMPSPMGAHYSASKGAIIAFTRTAAAELAAHRIRVNAICPGIVMTAQPRGYWSDEVIEDIGRHSLRRRVGKPEDMAYCVEYLLSDAASFVTGTTISVDGGF